jgi:DNA polymerase-3 subunit epsilon
MKEGPMNLIHFYDFETNGFPLWKKPSNDPGQPHIVQVASVVVDSDTRKTVSSFEYIACPDGWEIPDEVANIHGITTGRAGEVGVPEQFIVNSVLVHHIMSYLRVGHNESFDARIMRIALLRFGEDDAAEIWKAGNAECTQRLATPIVQAPATEKMKAVGRHGNKTANLGEAYEHFFGEKFEDAHTAMADVQATMAIYWAMKDLEDTTFVKVGGTGGAPEGDGVGFL